MLRKSLFWVGMILVVTFFVVPQTGCKAKYGCPANDNAHVQPNKKGEYKKTKSRSQLFPKGVGPRH